MCCEGNLGTYIPAKENVQQHFSLLVLRERILLLLYIVVERHSQAALCSLLEAKKTIVQLFRPSLWYIAQIFKGKE